MSIVLILCILPQLNSNFGRSIKILSALVQTVLTKFVWTQLNRTFQLSHIFINNFLLIDYFKNNKSSITKNQMSNISLSFFIRNQSHKEKQSSNWNKQKPPISNKHNFPHPSCSLTLIFNYQTWPNVDISSILHCCGLLFAASD